ncbi:MAG TPA: EAL domain-containing protein, partial [Candidatus Flavonifractor merdigallinarum]|nr:EAL domain-containing protein [Candidatus Flavonifractor merdigallinarum]
DTLPKQLERFMEQCRGLGITFALDDFGSGYSSVQMLLQYPVDLVKFDHSMVKEIAASQEKLDFIISTIQTCHQFKKKVCMEGVEQEEELERVRQTKCDYIQGFYYYRPLELDEFCEVLERDVKGGEDRCDRERNP